MLLHLGALACCDSVCHVLNERIIGVEHSGDAVRQAVVDVSPILTRLDEAALAQTRKVLAGVAWAQARDGGGIPGGPFAIAQRVEKNESRWIGQAFEEPCPDPHWRPPHHLRHMENDTCDSKQMRTWRVSWGDGSTPPPAESKPGDGRA
jgi:hypothetical protein